MRIKFNYKKEGFSQIFPLVYIVNDDEEVVLIGLGKTNIAFVFGNNNTKNYSNGGQVDEKDFTFIWYKKLQVDNTTHYTEPFRTVVKARNREEAVESLTQFALKKMVLCIREEDEFLRSDYSKLREDFFYINKKMADMEQMINI